MNERLAALARAGVSIWLDDLSRERIESGELAELITEKSVSGVTTNPTIFAAALSDLSRYGDQVAALHGKPIDEATFDLMVADVRDACRVFSPVFAQTGEVDGRVSIEVDPTLAMDAQATIAQAAKLAEQVGRPEVLVKIPATKPGLQAIRATIAAGISVNVTLIFSVERYLEVVDAYLSGLEDAAAAGKDLADIQSVASFFISRIDSLLDPRLTEIGTDEALALRGRIGVACGRAAYGAFLDAYQSDRFTKLAEQGANPQRLLWASTGVKNPDYPDTLYVSELVVDDTVNTMPEKTLLAFADHGEVSGDTVTPNIEAAQADLAKLAELGIDYAQVSDELEAEGVEKFEKSWQELLDSMGEALRKTER